MRKKLPLIKFQIFDVLKSPGPVCKHMHFDLIKMHQKMIFTKKTLIFKMMKLSRSTSKLWSIEMPMIRSKIHSILLVP